MGQRFGRCPAMPWLFSLSSQQRLSALSCLFKLFFVPVPYPRGFNRKTADLFELAAKSGNTLPDFVDRPALVELDKDISSPCTCGNVFYRTTIQKPAFKVKSEFLAFFQPNDRYSHPPRQMMQHSSCRFLIRIRFTMSSQGDLRSFLRSRYRCQCHPYYFPWYSMKNQGLSSFRSITLLIGK